MIGDVYNIALRDACDGMYLSKFLLDLLPFAFYLYRLLTFLLTTLNKYRREGYYENLKISKSQNHRKCY